MSAPADDDWTDVLDDDLDPTAEAVETDSAGGDTLREAQPDLDPGRPWSVQDTDRPGARAGAFLSRQAATFVTNLLLLITRIVPFSQRFWHGLVRAGLKGLHKSAGGDALGFIAEQGRIRVEPVQFEREHTRWVTQGEEYWNAASEADNTYLIAGRIPAVWAAAEANELGSHVQAEVAEVLDLGGGVDVYESATVQDITVTRELPEGGGEPAIADGGAQVNAERFISVADPGQYKDTLVSLGQFLGADESGRVVSMNKYYETYPEVVDAEEMKNQEDRGLLAAQDPDAYRKFVIKVLLIALGMLAIFVLGPPLIGALFGGGGGGGGIVPIMLAPGV